jgi:DNA-binding transcriptional LysR family regulator
MINIPTELLRTLIAVVDLRSFTRAAQALGVTQPAVSAQIKRLQMLLGGELLDKSAPGVTLTAKGEVVANYARRLLSINDQILDVSAHGAIEDRLRIGIPVDYFEGTILRAIADFRAEHRHLRLQICADSSEALLRELRRGEFDLIVAVSDEIQTVTALRTWTEEAAWGAASPAVFEHDGPIPLVVLGEGCLSRRISIKALERAGLPYEIVYSGASLSSMIDAAAAGHGVACWAKRALLTTGLQVFDSAPRLPKLADVSAGVYVRDDGDATVLKELADRIAESTCCPPSAEESDASTAPDRLAKAGG